VFEIMEEAPEQDAPNARALTHINGEVVIDRVCFKLRAGAPVLKDVTLRAEPGQMIALVGPTAPARPPSPTADALLRRGQRRHPH
jgi:ABC-type multidrug transport system fused ATPase/permease subunit